MGLADLHIHTVYSWDGMSAVSAVLKRAAEHTCLDVIAITDHDAIRGALEARDLAPSYGMEVIAGCEISTADGHLLALFIEKLVPAGLSLQETIARIGAQGGLCVAAHPVARGSGSLSREVIRQALQDSDLARVLVGIEVFNAGLFFSRSNAIALALAETLPVAQVGNSDSHLLDTIGDGATEFTGRTAADLRLALENHTTRAIESSVLNKTRFLTSWVPRYLLRKAGWVVCNPAPQAPLRLGRVRTLTGANSSIYGD